MASAGIVQPVQQVSPSASPVKIESTPARSAESTSMTQIRQTAQATPTEEVRLADSMAEADRSKEDTERSQAKILGEQVEKFLKSNSNILSFEKDKATNKVVVKILDPQTREVIRQIPPEEILRMAEALGDFQGLLLDKQA